MRTSVGVTAFGFLALALAMTRPVTAAAPAHMDPTPDVSVVDVMLDRYDFRKGDLVHLSAKVRRQAYTGSLRVHCYVDTGQVDRIASSNSVLGTLATVDWTATYDAGDATIVIGAYVEQVPGEENTSNNGLWQQYLAPSSDNPGAPRIAYDGHGHSRISEEAVKLANIPEVTQYAERIVFGSLAEDRFPDPVYGVSWFLGLSSLWTRHFWDVDKGEQGRGLWGRESAITKARAYMNGWTNHPGAIALYAAGNKRLAYEYLGRVAHLMEDMFSPAHVHLDAHMIDDEEVEKWGELHADEYSYDMAGAPFDGATLYDIFYHGAQLGDSLPSDDYEGDSAGFTDPGGWTPLLRCSDTTSRNGIGWDEARPEGMKQLFDRAIPGAISHVAGVLRYFWSQTHPGHALPEPATATREPAPPLGVGTGRVLR